MSELHEDNPCSVPSWLRPLVPVESRAWQRCCFGHDYDYRKGGTERDRLIADVRFFLCMLIHGVDPVWAERYYLAVRTYGRAAFGTGQRIAFPVEVVVEAP